MSTATYCAGRIAANSRSALAQLPAPRSISVHPGPIRARDLVGAALENGLFVARQRVLGQFADRLEQPRAERVVEELRRDRGCRSGKSGAQLGGRVGAGRQQIDRSEFAQAASAAGHAAV